MLTLSPEELVALVRSVFPRFETDRALAILVDVPRQPELDNPAWKERRRLAGEWHVLLQARKAEIPLAAVQLIAYPDVGSNNADLPAEGFLLDGPLPDIAAELERAGKTGELSSRSSPPTQLFLAPTEFSTTAPLKVAAKRFRFRAATMPGFAASMIPALRIDYGEVARRVAALKTRLERSRSCRYLLHGRRQRKHYAMHFDLRRRTAHASSGRFPEPAPPATCPAARPTSSPTRARRETRAGPRGSCRSRSTARWSFSRSAPTAPWRCEGEGPQAQAERAHLAARAGLRQHGRAGVRRAGRLRPGADRRDPARREAGPAHRLRAQRAFRGRRGAQGLFLARRRSSTSTASTSRRRSRASRWTPSPWATATGAARRSWPAAPTPFF